MVELFTISVCHAISLSLLLLTQFNHISNIVTPLVLNFVVFTICMLCHCCNVYVYVKMCMLSLFFLFIMCICCIRIAFIMCRLCCINSYTCILCCPTLARRTALADGPEF